MNKSLTTNLIAAALFIISYFLPPSFYREILRNAGLFALSGAVTNWLAIHMLFEKVPGLYGSGIIPANFEKLKTAIRRLIMENFFTEKDYRNYIENTFQQYDAQEIAQKINYSEIFDDFVQLLMKTPVGRLRKIGGNIVIEKLREPFIEKARAGVIKVLRGPYFARLLQQENTFANLKQQVETLVDNKLEELTPQMVKELIQKMIQEHLGWLVVWGGVFGGIFGVIAVVI